MKKQFLILSTLVLIISISYNTSWAQPYLQPTELECIDLTDGLRPVPGYKYLYDINVPAPDGEKTYRWFVTKDTQFMSGAALTSDREDPNSSEYLQWAADHYNAEITEGTTNSGDTISLRWNSFTLDASAGEYLFVVIHVQNEDADGCITSNLKVYRILPTHAFTLDIAAIDRSNADAVETTTEVEICVDDVQSAVFDPDHGDNGGVVYDFGSDTLYYIVAAANFTIGYQLSALFTGIQAATPDGSIGQTATIFWANDWADLQPTTWSPDGTTGLTENTPATLGVIEGEADKDGQMLYIAVVLKHNSFEAANVDGYPYALAVDGVLVDATLAPKDPTEFGDLHHQEIVATEGCDQDGFTNDVSTQRLKPRPTVEPTNPTPFLPITD